MAGESGAIRISTKLDNSGVLKGVKSLSSIFSKTEKSLSSIVGKGNGMSKPFLDAKQKARETEIAIDALKQKMQSIESAGESSGGATSKAYDNVISKIKQTELAAERTAEKMDAIFNQAKNTAKFNSFGNAKEEDALLDEALSSNKAYQSLGNQLDRLNLKLDQQKIAAQAAKQQAIDGTGTQGAEYQKLGSDVDKLNVKLAQYKSRMESASQAETGNVASISKLKSGLQSVGNKFKEVGNKALKSFGGSVKKGLISAGESIKNMMSHTNKADSSVSKLFSRIKSLAGAAFVFNILRKAFSSMASYLNGAISGNKQFSNSLAQVKGNLLTAFAPIFSAIMPALNALMSVLAKVTGYIAAFVSMLFGKSISASKASANALNNQAKGYGAAGSAAKKAAGALADFDELSVLQSQEDSSGGGGGGGGVSVAPDFGMDLSKMEDYFAKFDSLKEAFYGIGVSIGTAINEALSEIDWGKIQSKVLEVSEALGELFNGLFVDTIDWNLVGYSLGEGINTVIMGVNKLVNTIRWGELASKLTSGLNNAISTINWEDVGHFFANKFRIAIDMLYEFVTGFDWKGFGESLGIAVNTWFSDIDWKKAGTTLSEGLKGIFDSIFEFIATVDWQQIGTDIKDFLVAIDWAGVIAGLAKAIGGAIAGLALLLWGFIEDAVTSISDYFSQKFDEAGGNIIEGLWNGITEAFSAAVTWIKTNIFDPFINGFKEVFGIHSPSTVMSEMGTFIIEGLMQGIQDMIASLIAILESIKEKFTEKFTAIKNKVAEIWQAMKDKVSEVWEAIKKYISEKVETIKETVSRVFENVKTAASNIWNALKDSVSGIVDKMKDKLKEKVDSIKETFVSVFTNMKETVIGIFDNIWSGIKKIINSILGGIEKMANGVINGLNSMINAMNKLSFDVPDWVPVIGGNNFGFSIPNIGNVSIPRLAKGAVIPANHEFMAVLGDQKSGRNLEAPESLIRQIVREEGGGQQGDIIVKIEGNLGALARVLKIEAERESSRIGGAMIGGTI